MKKLLVLVVVLVLVGAASWAQNIRGTGQWLHDLWGATQREQNNTATRSDARDAFLYVGYVEGSASVMGDAGWIDLGNTTTGQLFTIVGKYLDDHPEQWTLHAQLLVYRALYAVWPGTTVSPYQLHVAEFRCCPRSEGNSYKTRAQSISAGVPLPRAAPGGSFIESQGIALA
jgi:hypothetical protein